MTNPLLLYEFHLVIQSWEAGQVKSAGLQELGHCKNISLLPKVSIRLLCLLGLRLNLLMLTVTHARKAIQTALLGPFAIHLLSCGQGALHTPRNIYQSISISSRLSICRSILQAVGLYSRPCLILLDGLIHFGLRDAAKVVHTGDLTNRAATNYFKSASKKAAASHCSQETLQGPHSWPSSMSR